MMDSEEDKHWLDSQRFTGTNYPPVHFSGWEKFLNGIENHGSIQPFWLLLFLFSKARETIHFGTKQLPNGKVAPTASMSDEIMDDFDNEEFSIDTIGTTAVVFVLKVNYLIIKHIFP